MNRNLLYLLLIFSSLFLIPVFFRLLDKKLEKQTAQLLTFTQNNALCRIVSTVLFVVFLSVVMAFWMPGDQWADSPYLFLIISLLSLSWSLNRMYGVTHNKKETTLSDYHHISTVSLKNIIKETFASFFRVSLVFLGIVTLLAFTHGQEESWIVNSYPILLLSFVLIFTSALLGGSIVVFTNRRNISNRFEKMTFIFAILPYFFPDEWHNRIVSVPLLSLSLWGVLLPSICFFILSGVLLQRRCRRVASVRMAYNQ